jgi:uncharacterized secreted protein with C-terminal beta-propeller domain
MALTRAYKETVVRRIKRNQKFVPALFAALVLMSKVQCGRIDISNPTNPQRVGGYDTSGLAVGVALSGKYAYVADNQDGLQVIEISNPANPQQVGNYDTTRFAAGVAIMGNYAYVADGPTLDVIDISNPTSPRLAGQSLMSGGAVGVAVSGNYAYVADADAYGLILAQGKAFVTLGNDGLAIFDVLPFFKFKSVTHRDGQLELSWEGSIGAAVDAPNSTKAVRGKPRRTKYASESTYAFCVAAQT